MEQERIDQAYNQGWLDAYERRGYALDHGGAIPNLSAEERAYITGYKAGEAAFEDDMTAHCYEGGGKSTDMEIYEEEKGR